MPTIKTIKPDGTGDFTTLATWQSWAAAQSTPDQWAECYSGDVGNIDFNGQTLWGASTASAYVKIYAAAGHRHSGKDDATPCAYISKSSGGSAIGTIPPFCQIDGMRINITVATNTSTVGIFSNASGYTPCHIISNNLIIFKGASTTFANFGISVVSALSTTTPTLIYNNIVYFENAYNATTVGINLNPSSATTSYALLNIFNNLVYQGQISITCSANKVTIFGTYQFANNSIFSWTTSGCIVFSTTTNQTISGSNNATYDSTSTSFGFTSGVTGLVAASQLVSPTSDWSLLSSSTLIDAGISKSSTFVTDIVGVSRPQGTAWDISPFEYIPPALGSIFLSPMGVFCTL